MGSQGHVQWSNNLILLEGKQKQVYKLEPPCLGLLGFEDNICYQPVPTYKTSRLINDHCRLCDIQIQDGSTAYQQKLRTWHSSLARMSLLRFLRKWVKWHCSISSRLFKLPGRILCSNLPWISKELQLAKSKHFSGMLPLSSTIVVSPLVTCLSGCHGGQLHVCTNMGLHWCLFIS